MPKSIKDDPKCIQDHLKSIQDLPLCLQEHPKSIPDEAKFIPDVLKPNCPVNP